MRQPPEVLRVAALIESTCRVAIVLRAAAHAAFVFPHGCAAGLLSSRALAAAHGIKHACFEVEDVVRGERELQREQLKSNHAQGPRVSCLRGRVRQRRREERPSFRSGDQCSAVSHSAVWLAIKDLPGASIGAWCGGSGGEQRGGSGASHLGCHVSWRAHLRGYQADRPAHSD